MKLADTVHGPQWVMWVVFAIFAIISAILLSGHGGMFIAGYNTATDEEKENIDEKKLCRVIGSGLAFISLVILVSAAFMKVLPSWFAYVMLGCILVTCAVLLVLANTFCKKK